MRAGFLGLLALAAVAAGCGGDDTPRGVQVTEASDDFRPPARPRQSAAFDTVYADSGRFADPRPDSLRRDSLRRDSLRPPRPDDPPAPQAAPDFRAFWPQFLKAVRAGCPPTAALAAFSDALPRADFEETYQLAFGEPFRAGVLALTPRDVRREGTARVAQVTVGYDAEGAVVPVDEAETESAVILRFDVVDGDYRLVRVDVAG